MHSTSQLAQLLGRLAALSAHELQCLHGDPELERQLGHTQRLLEARLAQLRARLGRPPTSGAHLAPLDLTGSPVAPAPAACCVAPNPKKAWLARAPAPAKKYKGEFDEPSAAELEARLGALVQPGRCYHRRLAGAGDAGCACLVGAHFDGRSPRQVLDMVDRWRALPAERRLAHKWHVADLPKDIALADIKRLEERRRALSGGRADFGGASKRKPLGIRATRQFLLVLYCLWGHPGRQDPMQRDGYCPHCFARIKKANEQSTLVRLVNHFNMKHRQGANPRLSPRTRALTPLEPV